MSLGEEDPLAPVGITECQSWGCHVYLSKNSLDCEIVSAKSSEMNVLIPTEGGDFNEFPVPEQFKTLWSGQKLVTTVTEIAG